MRRRLVLRIANRARAWASPAGPASPQQSGEYQPLRSEEDGSSFPPYLAPRLAAAKRRTPGFGRQFAWCLRRAALQRGREPRAVFLSYAIIALTGARGCKADPSPAVLQGVPSACCA
jgi:hypothetical protein